MLASDLPVWFVRVFAFAFGAVWGSFANVVIYRWPREMSVVKPGSHCFACGKPVRAFDNVPIFAWLWLRGRCRDCGARVSPRYAVVELLFAVVSLAIATRVFDPETARRTAEALADAQREAGAAVTAMEPLTVTAALGHYAVRFAVAGVLLVATFIDLDEMIVPSFVKYFAVVPLAGALLLPPLIPTVSVVMALIGAGVGYLGLRVLFIDGYKLLTGRRGMGLGDAEILLLVGALLGPLGVAFALGAGAVQGVVATGIAMAFRARIGPAHADEVEDEDEEDEEREARAGDASEDAAGEESEGSAKKLKAKVPFVPFLALAALEYLLGMDAVFDTLLRP